MLENTYAEALHKMIGQGRSPKVAVAALHELLKRKGRAALLPRIARAFQKIAERDHRRNILTLSIADKNATHAKTEAKHTLSIMNIDPKDVETKVDETLIGGWRLEGREHLYDASFKKHLLELYKRATST